VAVIVRYYGEQVGARAGEHPPGDTEPDRDETGGDENPGDSAHNDTAHKDEGGTGGEAGAATPGASGSHPPRDATTT